MLPAIGIALAAGGALASYLGGQSEAAKQAAALEEARRRQLAATNAMEQAQYQAGAIHQGEMAGHLSRIIGQYDQGGADATARRAAITQAAGPTTSTGNGLAQHLYSLAQARVQPSYASQDAAAAIGFGDRNVAASGRAADIAASRADIPLAEARYRYARDTGDTQGWLQRELASGSNAANNLRLLGNVAGAGAQTAWAFA